MAGKGEQKKKLDTNKGGRGNRTGTQGREKPIPKRIALKMAARQKESRRR